MVGMNTVGHHSNSLTRSDHIHFASEIDALSHLINEHVHCLVNGVYTVPCAVILHSMMCAGLRSIVVNRSEHSGLYPHSLLVRHTVMSIDQSVMLDQL